MPNRTRPPMRPTRRAAVPALLAAAVALSGCGEGGLAGGLRQVGVGTATPDEFLVLPTRPLETPPDFATLPPPTPGAANRVDYQPQADAITALTGRPAPATASGGALAARVGPADPAIRATLAQEDFAYRGDHRPRLFERWFGRDQSRIVYAGQALDAEAEWRRLRAQGARTPAAPPIAD